MDIRYHFTKDGGFVAGDVETGATCYAYPTSEHATKAKRNPKTVATEMLTSELACGHFNFSACAEYDRRNWQQIGFDLADRLDAASRRYLSNAELREVVA